MTYIAKTAREEPSQHNPLWLGHSVLSASHAEPFNPLQFLETSAVHLGGGASVARGTVHELCLTAVAGTEMTFPDSALAGELVCGGDISHGIPVFSLGSPVLLEAGQVLSMPCDSSHMASLWLTALHRTCAGFEKVAKGYLPVGCGPWTSAYGIYVHRDTEEDGVHR